RPPTPPRGGAPWSRYPPSLRSTGVLPFPAYQRCPGSHAVRSSSLDGWRVVSWISATAFTDPVIAGACSAVGPVVAHLEPEEVPGTQRHQHLSVVADLGESLTPEQAERLASPI